MKKVKYLMLLVFISVIDLMPIKFKVKSMTVVKQWIKIQSLKKGSYIGKIHVDFLNESMQFVEQ
jgi:hypothetical protein